MNILAQIAATMPKLTSKNVKSFVSMSIKFNIQSVKRGVGKYFLK